MALSEQLAPNVIPVVRDYIEARIQETQAPLLAEIARLQALVGELGRKAASDAEDIRQRVSVVSNDLGAADLARVERLERRLARVSEDLDAEKLSRIAERAARRE